MPWLPTEPTRVGAQSGYILLPVVMLITLVSVVAFLLNHESALGTGITGSNAEADRAEYIARAGLAHATWGGQNSGCAGDLSMTTVPFGQAGTYTATITTPGGTTTGYPNLAADQDAWFRSDNITVNNGGASSYHLRRESGNLEYAVVRFDLSSLPAGAQINSAVASFYVKVGKGHPEGPVTVHRATADWTETGATWETMGDKYHSAVLDSIPAQSDAGDNWVTVNLTAQVQAWVNGGQPNYGIMLIPTGEGTHAEYVSREGVASQQPQLDVIVGTGPATPAIISATGTLTGNPSPANDISRALTRINVPAYQPTSYSFLQLQSGAGKDAMLSYWYDTKNYGDYRIRVVSSASSPRHSLVQFKLAAIPVGAKVIAAQLQLYHTITETPGADAGVAVHRVSRDWVEGTQSGAGTADGASWLTWDGTNAWTTAGGDYDPAPVANSPITDTIGDWESWDISTLVQGWLDGSFANNGLLLKGTGTVAVSFASKEDADPALHPKLSITYACECGSPCLAPQGSGALLMVVINPTTLVPLDAYKKALFESWGYTVAVIGESENQASYDSAIAAADVVFISETVNASQVGTKLKDVTIGVVSQDGSYNSALGFAGGSAWSVGPALNVTDTSHYITAVFPTGALDIYSAGMEQLTVAGTGAPGLQTLADTGGAGSLVVLDTGAMGSGGTPLAGRRVMLPLGRDTNLNWDYLNGNGRLLVQRALQWGTGNIGAPPKQLLLVVVDPSALTAQEAAKKTLIESWGYTVNLIDESDSQANFDAAITANDVAYIPQDINSTNLGTKLANATIGVVNEDGEQVDELDFSNEIIFKTNHEIDVVDNSHYITQPFATGFLTFVSSDQSVHMLSGQIAPGLQTLGQTFNVGSQYNPSLATLDVGDTLSSGGSAAGRRVELPWGGGTCDINLLTGDGRTIMRRAIEWGAGAGSAPAPAYNVLLVVGDATTLASKDVGYKALMESWGYTVTLIDDGDTQANFDAAAAANDVVFVSGTIGGGTLGNKLTGSTAPIVNEFYGKLDNFGFSSSTSSTVNADGFTTTNAAHYITQPFSGNPVTVFTSSLSMPVPGGTLAPDLTNVGEISGTSGLVTLDTDATRHDGNPAPARRVHLPFASAETTSLTTDGETVLQRSLEWGAGAGDVTYTVLMVVSDPASLTPAADDRKTLMESWGYTVNLIDDDDSALNFDAGITAADVVYVGSGSTPTVNVTKMLTDTTRGVVSEPVAMASISGFASSSVAVLAVDQLTIVDSTHSITQGLASPATVFTSPLVPAALSGTLSPDLQNLAAFLGAPALAVLESGATTHDAQTTAGRRANLPFATAGSGELTADGQLLVRRAIEWAAGSGGGGGGGPTGVVFEEFTYAKGTAATNLSINNPPGTVTEDLLIATLVTDGSTSGSMLPPAGWNVVDLDEKSSEVTFGVWWKLAGASEPASYSFSWSDSQKVYGTVMRFTGHDPVNPIHVSANDGGSSSAPPSPAVTTTVPDTMILRLGGFDDDDITIGDPGLTGHTAITMDKSSQGNGTSSSGAGYLTQAAAGDSGTSTFTLTNSEEYRTVTIGIAPAP